MRHLTVLALLISLSTEHAYSGILSHLSQIEEDTPNEVIADWIRKTRAIPSEKRNEVATVILNGELTTEHKRFLGQWNRTDKSAVHQILKVAVRESQKTRRPTKEILLERIRESRFFTESMNNAEDFYILDAVENELSFHAIVFGSSNWQMSDGSYSLTLALGPGAAYKHRYFYDFFMCFKVTEYFIGIGGETGAGFMGGVSAGTWVGSGVCVNLGAGLMWGAYARLSLLMTGRGQGLLDE